MKINDTYYISGKKESESIYSNLINTKDVEYIPTDKEYATLRRILQICRKHSWTDPTKNSALKRTYQMLGINDPAEIEKRLFKDSVAPVTSAIDPDTTADTTTTLTPEEAAAQKLAQKKTFAKQAIEKIMKFFSEFNFSPSYRFINSFARTSNKKEYVINYFKIQDHAYAPEIEEKVKSSEFKYIIEDFNKIKPENIINHRFELYFGEPGAGKTVKATSLTDFCMVCSSDMLPADLMQNFVFKDGKADFDKSDLWIAMEEGKTITLDEVNMLPFESLRFLQGITDGKESFDYKGHEVKIHPDFKIYATMNLNVNGQCIPLPAPLVDRSYDIVEFKLTADNLVDALF